MISRQDIQRLLHHANGDLPILSISLDMSVNEMNKRTYRTFLNQERSRFLGMAGDRETHPGDPLGEAFDRVQGWIDDEFDVANKGAAIYTTIGADWVLGLQFPVPAPNQATIDQHPQIGALAQILGKPHHFGVIIVDRESLRLIDLRLGSPVAEHEVKTSPYPTPSDVRAGGEASTGYQKRKAEEARHYFKVFSLEITEFVNLYRPDGLILMGTEANTQRFLESMPKDLQDLIVHIDHAPAVPSSAAVVERLAPFLEEFALMREAETIDRLRGGVEQGYLAVSGFGATLEQLQEGKVDTLVIAERAKRAGQHCLNCGFYLTTTDSACRYCGGPVEADVDLVEAMLRLAAEQEVDIAIVDQTALTDLGDTGGLLRF